MIKYKNNRYEVIYNVDDRDLTNSYINHRDKIIYIRRKLDLFHELIHLIMHELRLQHDIEEFLVTYLSENFEILLLENLENDIITQLIF